MSDHYCMYKDGMCELDIDEAYQQGRADERQDIMSKYMLLTENQVLYIIAEANVELIKRIRKTVKNALNSYNPSYIDIYNVITELSDVVINIIDLFAEQLKEINNERIDKF